MSVTKSKILAIDDTPVNLLTLGAVLAEEYDLRIASSGSEGLAMAARDVPDLILLDVMMPEVDGFETCRRLRADPTLAEVPVVFLTALTDYEPELTGLSLGAVDYIAKPFRVELVKQRIRNILQLRQLSQELRASEEQLRFVMAATGDGIWDWDIVSGQVQHNAEWCRMLGLDPSRVEHPLDQFKELLHPEDAPRVLKAIDCCVAGDGTYSSEHRMRHADGHYLWVSDCGDVVRRGLRGEPLRMVGSIKDISLRKRQEAEIQHLAFYDPLTELPNRRLLIDRLQQSIISKKRSNGCGALMFLDMDRFKQLNDTHGHAMGDLLLIQVAERLQRCVRQVDTVARLGGDEFVVMLDGLEHDPQRALAAAGSVGEKILRLLNQPYQLGSLDYSSTPSIGLTIFTSNESSIDAVIKRADSAMYEAKAAGRNTLRVALASEEKS